jgi:hypothetical protein
MPKGRPDAPAVLGVQEAMRTLQALDPAIKKEAVAEIKSAAEPLRSAIASRIPTTAPLSGMAHKGRTGWGKRGGTTVSTKYGGRARARGGKDVTPLVSIVLKGAAASIYDMAGRGGSGTTTSGQALVSGLTSRGGSASRAAWPAADASLGQIQAAVMEAIRKAAARANVSLAEKG